MNLTLFALSTSLLSNSPFISLTNYGHSVSFFSQKLKANHFYNNFIISYASIIHASFSQSSFSMFLSSPLFFRNEEEPIRYNNMLFTERNLWGNSELFVISCTFENCSAQNDELGGAIHFEKYDSILTIHGSIFNNCKAADGGGIFACAQQKQTNTDEDNVFDIMTHVSMPNFNSQYCCYSFCTAIIDNSNEKKAGYGSAILVASDNINLNYSSTFQCPSKAHYMGNGDSPSYGAQFDLKTKNIDSCNINATSGYSRACSAIEYRDAEKGRFQFQTVVDQKGGFITSFTKLVGPVKISECNFINNTVKYKDFNPTLCSIIHVRMKDVRIDNFCFSGISFEGYEDKDDKKRIVSKGSDSGYSFDITIQNSFFDANLNVKTYFNEAIVYDNNENNNNNDITSNDISSNDITSNDITSNGFINNNNIFTNGFPTKEINQLKLGYCQGKQDPPPTFETSYFSQSEYFSNSVVFSKSADFSHSKEFIKSAEFTRSGYFSKSDLFSITKGFSESSDFTHSSFFTKSSGFSKSNDFSESGEFTKTVEFTKTGEFSESTHFSNSAAFSESNDFTTSKGFTASDDFLRTSKFTASQTFTASNSFTQSSSFTSSNSFTQSNSFTPSNHFTQSDKFSNSLGFTASFNFTEPVSLLQGGGSKKPTAAIIGGIVGGVAAVALIAFLAAYFIRKNRMSKPDSADVETITDSTEAVENKNPLYNNAEDDPFKEDF